MGLRWFRREMVSSIYSFEEIFSSKCGKWQKSLRSGFAVLLKSEIIFHEHVFQQWEQNHLLHIFPLPFRHTWANPLPLIPHSQNRECLSPKHKNLQILKWLFPGFWGYLFVLLWGFFCLWGFWLFGVFFFILFYLLVFCWAFFVRLVDSFF